MSPKLKKLVVYNTTDKPIFITTHFVADPKGGHGIDKTEYCIGPLDGIDLSIIGLSTVPPTKCKHCSGTGKLRITQFGAHVEYNCSHCNGPR